MTSFVRGPLDSSGTRGAKLPSGLPSLPPSRLTDVPQAMVDDPPRRRDARDSVFAGLRAVKGSER